MKISDDETMKVTLETNRRYEVREMHSFDTDAGDKKSLCASTHLPTTGGA